MLFTRKIGRFDWAFLIHFTYKRKFKMKEIELFNLRPSKADGTKKTKIQVCYILILYFEILKFTTISKILPNIIRRKLLMTNEKSSNLSVMQMKAMIVFYFEKLASIYIYMCIYVYIYYVCVYIHMLYFPVVERIWFPVDEGMEKQII